MYPAHPFRTELCSKGCHKQESKAVVELVLHGGSPLIQRFRGKAGTKAMGTKSTGRDGEEQEQGTCADQVGSHCG